MFWPRPPKSCFTTRIANTPPITGIQRGACTGMFMASRRPVTSALPSAIVTGFFIPFSYRYSVRGQTAIEIAIKSSARRPKFQTPTQAAGARASRTANMILSVVTLDRACGEDDTCNNPFICKVPLFLLSLCQKHFTH